MDIEGTYTLQASVEQVCQCLVDIQTLRHAMPGLERLEQTGQRSYAFTLRIKQAPLRGIYQGKVMVNSALSSDSYMSYRFSIEEDGEHNPLQGTWEIRLSQQYDNTVVVYNGTLNLSRMNALLPPLLVKGAVKVFIQQFFANLAEQMRATAGPLHVVPGFDALEAREGDGDERNGQNKEYGGENEHHVVAYFKEPTNSEGLVQEQTITYRLVRLVGLGGHDPALEEQWVARLKRYGAFSVLLLLVWIGTRLPRRLLPRN